MATISNVVRNIGFFQGLDEPIRTRVLERVRALNIRKMQNIIEHGSHSFDVYFLIEGELRVLLYSPDGREVSVRTLKAGDIFGEIAAIDGLQRSATVVAVCPSIILSMAREDFLRCLDQSPAAALWLIRQSVGQIRRLTDKIFELSALNVRSRLHCELLRLVIVSGVTNNQAIIKPAPTHLELANRIGSHREAITRELGELTKRKVLLQTQRQLKILNVDHLSRSVERLGTQPSGVHMAPSGATKFAELVFTTSEPSA